MALQVWLPLNGNLENQGLNNVTITPNGGSDSFNVNGKIGKCLAPSSRYYVISSITLGSEASICCWSKTTVNGKMTWVLGASVYSYLNLYEATIYTLNTGDANNNPFQNNGSNVNVLHDGKWHHFAVTFGNNKATLYIDGDYAGTAKTFKSPACTNSSIKLAGGFSNGHTYDWNGYLNDFRVYNNCLSPKEVKEIAKGLILHYPLNTLNNSNLGNVNLLAPSLLSNSPPWTKALRGTEIYKGKEALLVYSVTMYVNTSNGATSIFPDLAFKSNTLYTLSITWCDHLRTDTYSCSLYFRFRYDDGTLSGNLISPAFNSDAEWKHVSLTSAAGKTVSMICSTYERGGNVSIADIKLEEGAVETPNILTLDDINLIKFPLSTTYYSLLNYAGRTSSTLVNGVYHVDGYLSETAIDTSFNAITKLFLTLKPYTDYYLTFFCNASNGTALFFNIVSPLYTHTGLRDSSGTNFFNSLEVPLGGKEFEGVVTLKVHTGEDTLYKVVLGFDTPNLFGIDSFIEFRNIILTENNPNEILDYSGYGNNGEVYNYDYTGKASIVENSPRYEKAIFLNSAAVTSESSGTIYIYGHCSLTTPNLMSVAFWCKPTSAGYGGTTGQGLFCTTTYAYGNTYVGSDYTASAMNHRDLTVDINASDGGTLCRLSFLPTLNEWHHYAITYDGQTGKLYKDGVLTSTASFSEAKTLDSFIGVVIGFSKAGGVWRRNKSCFSDFRLYTTAISEEDIKELYNTSAIVDNNGNNYAYQFKESLNHIILSPPISSYRASSGSVAFNGKEVVFTGYSSSYSGFIEIDVTKTLFYDFTYSNTSGSKFYVGFERYDENKATVSNYGCIYVLNTTSAQTEKRLVGTITLEPVNGNPCKYTKIRILSNWTNSTISDGVAKIHSFNFIQIDGTTETEINKQGIFNTGWFMEDLYLKSLISKNKYVTTTQLIEI